MKKTLNLLASVPICLSISLVSFYILLGASLCACSNGEEPGNPSEPIENITLDETGSRAVAETKEFQEKFTTIFLSKAHENAVCSPLSATVCLSLFANGVDENVAKEFEATFGTSLTNLNSMCEALMDQLPRLDPQVKVKFANSVWYQDNLSLASDFQGIANNKYKADTFGHSMKKDWTDFQSKFNNWVDKKTDGMIKEFTLEPADLVLANATYFKGAWNKPFNTKETKPATFHGKTGDSDVNMMHQSYRGAYTKGADYEGVRINFGDNKKFVAHFILPAEDSNADKFLNEDGLARYLAATPEYAEIKLYLPRFEFADPTPNNITGILRTMGMQSLGKEIDLKMFKTSEKLYDSSVLQKCAVKVNESGAEAAAVTVVNGFTDNPPSLNATVRFDKPFVFLFTEHTTGTILFAGKINQL